MLTIKQVAEKVNVSRNTVYYNWIRHGKLKAIRFDGMYRIKESDLEEFIRKQQIYETIK